MPVFDRQPRNPGRRLRTGLKPSPPTSNRRN